MIYMGSKARFAKDLLPIILKDRTEEQYYVEPFVSEYNAPSDFECVWQKEVNVAIRPNKTLAQVEKLFKFSPTNVQ